MPHHGRDNEFNDKIRCISLDLNDTSNFASRENAKKQRHLIILYLANIYPSFKDAGKVDKADNLRYFTGPQLERVRREAAKKWEVAEIEFDRPRAAETYESCQKDEDFARVKIEGGKNKLYALTKKGFNHCQELIESIYNTKFSQTTSNNDNMNKITVTEDFLTFNEYVKRREVQTIIEKYPIFIGREREMEKLNNFMNDPTRSIMLITGNGGTGKTRLILEFVKDLQNKTTVCFINPYKPKFPNYIPNNAVIILDDTYRKIYLH